MDAPLNGKNTVNDLIARVNDLTLSVDTATEGAISGPGIAVTDKLVSFADTTGQILKQASNVSDFAYTILDDVNQAAMQTTLGIKSAGLLDATPNNTANRVVQRDSSGNFSANLISSAVRGQVSREFYPGAAGLYHWQDVAGYVNGGSSVTGTMKITLPVGWTNTMMSIIIRGYNQMGQGGAYEYTISGYNASPWTRRAAEVSGNVPTVLPIRFGFDGTKACILIGDVTTVWAYPRLAITDVITSYAGANTGWDAGWVIAPITDETGITVSGAAYPNIVVHAASLELGSQANEPSNAVVDFHTGSTSVDYDSRIIGVSGTGNGTNGAGTLHIVAAEVNMATGAGTTQVVKVNTQPADTNSQVVASTAFVLGQGSTVNPLMDGVAAPGTSLRFSKADHVHPADTTKAPLASPALTGVPTAPTAGLNTNTTQVATTAYVIGQAATVVSPMDGVAAVGTSTRFARQDHVHPADTTKVNTSTLGVANGVATLDATGLVPTTQLPAYVDDVLEFANLAAFPTTGESGKIYVALNTNKTYRWSGSAYIYITSGAVDSVAGKTGVVTLVKGDVGLGSVDNTSDANKPVSTAQQSALDLKAPLASPALTGAPTAPTAAVGTSTTQVATTAFVNAEIANDAPTKTGGGASGSWGISVTGSSASCSGLAASATTLTGLTATVTELNYTVGVTSAIQTQLNDKAPLTGAGTSGSWPISVTGSAASASAVAWSGVSGKPTTLAGYGITNGYAMDGVNTGWFRSSNASGWYNETYGGGIHMQDATYVRTYNNTAFLCTNVMRVEGATPQVQLWDSDHSILRYLYADGGSIGFLNSTGNWSLTNDNSGNTTSTGNVTAYSDIRLKKDIELIPDALDKVCALRGVTYERIDSGERQTGVIAQEVQAVLPEAVMTMTDEQQTLSVAYGNLVGLLIEAIKELKAEVDVLKQGAK